jgi:hypothetical protein
MNHFGCDEPMKAPAAFAVMETNDFASAGVEPMRRGPACPDNPGRSFAAVRKALLPRREPGTQRSFAEVEGVPVHDTGRWAQ